MFEKVQQEFSDTRLERDRPMERVDLAYMMTSVMTESCVRQGKKIESRSEPLNWSNSYSTRKTDIEN